MPIIAYGAQDEREQSVLEKGYYGGVVSADDTDPCCWYCGEVLAKETYSEAPIDRDGRLVWVPVCENCCPPTPPTLPLAARLALPIPPTLLARLACPICDQTLTPPRRHRCGGAGKAGGAASICPCNLR